METAEHSKPNPPTLGQKTARALLWNFIGRLGIMGGRGIENLLLVWLLGAAGYGVFSATTNLFGILLPFTALGLKEALSRFLPEMENGGVDSRPWLRKVLLFRAGVCLAVMVVMVIFARTIAFEQLKDAEHWPLVVMAAAMVLIHGVRDVQFRVLVARFRQKYLNAVQVGELFGYLALALILIFVGAGIFGALVAMAAAGIVVTVLATIKIRKTQPQADIAGGKQGPTLRRMIAFSGAFYGYELLNTVLQKHLDIFLISQLHDDIRQVGYYTTAYLLAYMAVSISGKALAEGITLTIVAEARAGGDDERLRKIYLLLLEYLYIFTFPAIAGIYAIGGPLLGLVYGGKMNGAVLPVMVFLPAMALAKMGGLTATFLAGLDRERIMVLGRVVFGSVNIVLNFVLIPKYGALGAVIATSIATGVGAAFELIVLQVILHPRYPWGYFLKMTVTSVGIFLVARLIDDYLPIPEVPRLALAVVGGVAVYLIGLVVLRPISADNIRLAGSLKLPGQRWILKLLAPKNK